MSNSESDIKEIEIRIFPDELAKGQYQEVEYIRQKTNEALSMNRYGLGIRLLREAIKLLSSPGYETAGSLSGLYYELALALIDVGEHAEAKELISGMGTSSWPGEVFLRLGDYDNALLSFSETGDYVRLGHLHLSMGKFNEAVIAFRK
ncbi:MAG: hypothetical protein ABIC40_04385, partial [bacterium]